MVANAKEVGERRYRESYGRYLEDFKEGDRVVGSVGSGGLAEKELTLHNKLCLYRKAWILKLLLHFR